MQQPEAQPLQLARGEPRVGLLRRGDLELLRLLDQRAHDVRLPAGGDLARARPPTPRPRAAARPPSGCTMGVRPGGSSSSTLTSRSPYTVIAAVRGIGVAVITSTSGTVAAGLLPQRGALLDAEPVLLVDDDDAEAVELDPLLDQRVGADDDVDRCRRPSPASTPPALGAAHPVGQQLDAQRPVGEQVRRGRAPRSPSSSRRTPAACCSASTSVGAISAPW